MTFRASLVVLTSVSCFGFGACGGKQEPANAGPASVAGPTRTPAAPKPPPSVERQPRREIEPRAPVDPPAPPVKVDKVERVERVEKLELTEKVDKVAPTEKTERIEKVEPTEKVDKVDPPAPDGPSGDADHPTGEAKYALTITDAAVTPEVADRIPTERKTSWTIGTDTKVIAWFEVKNTGDRVPLTLVWKKNGKESWRFDTEIGKGKNWRTWAEKKIGKKDAGKWTVELVDDGGYAYETLAYEVVAGATATAP